MGIDEHDLKVLALAFNMYSPFILTKFVDPLPHQLDGLYGGRHINHQCNALFPHKTEGILRSRPPMNALVADETGLGKTVIAGTVISRFKLAGYGKRILIASPKSVTVQWKWELSNKFGIITNLVRDTGSLRNFPAGSTRIVSMDFLKFHVDEFVESVKSLDLLVIDEAHHVLGANETMLFEMVDRLKDISGSKLLLTATPFRGSKNASREEHRLEQLLNNDTVYIRRLKDNITDLRGRRLFPPRKSITVPVDSTIMRELHEGIKRIEFDLPIKRLILMKRLASSLSSFLSSLERLTRSNRLDENFYETDDVVGKEPDLMDDKGPKWREEEIERLAELRDRLGKTDREELLDKEKKLVGLIKSWKDQKVVVFTEYKSTLDSIAGEFHRAGIGFATLYGDMEVEEREREMKSFLQEERKKVFLSTDAGGEGINLQVAKVQINFDIPWSPIKLE